jgi:hypothetical protein
MRSQAKWAPFDLDAAASASVSPVTAGLSVHVKITALQWGSRGSHQVMIARPEDKYTQDEFSFEADHGTAHRLIINVVPTSPGIEYVLDNASITSIAISNSVDPVETAVWRFGLRSQRASSLPGVYLQSTRDKPYP